MSGGDNQRSAFFAEQEREEVIFSALDELLPAGASGLNWGETVRKADAAIRTGAARSSMALARCQFRDRANPRG